MAIESRHSKPSPLSQEQIDAAWARLKATTSYQHFEQMKAIRELVSNGEGPEVETMSQQGKTVWEKFKSEAHIAYQASQSQTPVK